MLLFSILMIVSVRQGEPQTASLPNSEKKQATRNELERRPAPVRLVGPFYLERSRDGFGIRSHGVIEKTASGSKFYPLPQSSVETYRRLRAEDLKYMLPHMLTAKDYERQEVIGPYQVEGDHIWFGNQFYDGEGEHGVGTFGYFDTQTRKDFLLIPPEIARWETSALLVEPDAIWLALDHFGEDISTSPGGLLRWDRASHNVRHYPLEFVVTHINRDEDNPSALLLSTRGGYALLSLNGEVRRFRVQKSSSGKELIMPIGRFPPPPSHY